MPKVGNYRANSVIYFQGDASDKVFILQSGKVSLNYSDIETGKDVHEVIQTGEFFGVKSAMGKYPREENALVMQDAQVLTFSVPEFEVFSQANIRIIMKMLKVFSTQLRRVHKQVENLLEKPEAQSPEAGLFRAGEYYLRNRQYSQAKYVFSRYLTYYPAGKLAESASHYLEMSESGALKYGDGKGPSPLLVEATRGDSGRQEARPQTRSASDEGQPKGGAANASAAAPKAGPAGLAGAEKLYYDAVSLYSSEKYREALAGFKKIVEANEDAEYVSKALYDMGRCLFMLQQYDLTIKQFTQLAQSYPKHPDLVDALYFLGQAYEKKGDSERARGFYKKILSMEADEDASTRIKATKSLRKLEEARHG